MSPSKVRIGDRAVGDGEPCFVIAEAGINHNGDMAIAKRLIEAAATAGADAVKFQKRTLSGVYQASILENPRQGEQGLQYIVPILAEFELSEAAMTELRDHCARIGMMFLCTPWDPESVDFLVGLGVPALKIGSPDMTNFLLLEHAASKGLPLIVSTGMATEEEVLRTVAFLKDHVAAPAILLHCVSAYPPAVEEMNLRFMQKLREWSGFLVGLSSHDTGTTISAAAVAVGACVVERHITLDRGMRGPDHAASLEPDTFARQVREIREVEAALGAPHRWITRGELLNRRVLGKSLVAGADIVAGTGITREMVRAKSPGLGVSPQRVGELVGQVARRAIRRDEPFVEADLSGAVPARPARPLDIGTPWGVVVRFHDVETILRRFAREEPRVLEFHLSDRDIDAGMAGFRPRPYAQDLIVHAPEYCHDALIDLCAADEGVRKLSLERLQLAIDLARRMAPSFAGVPAPGPKVVVHVGGMSPGEGQYDVTAAYARLGDSVRRLETDGVELLVENLPPYPWYFGGRWFGHVLVDGPTTARFCAETNLGLCFDTSHAALACNHTGSALTAFAEQVLPYVRHLHISDAAGVSGEGLQIGEGQIDFVNLLPLVAASGASAVPEVWCGHHQDGQGFLVALERLSEIHWAARALRAHDGVPRTPELDELVVPAGGSLADVLRVIDRNKLGTAFVVDDVGVMQGVVTDGDIRRALMRGVSREGSLVNVMNRDFTSARHDAPVEEIRGRLSHLIRVLPLLDHAGRLVGFDTMYPRTR